MISWFEDKELGIFFDDYPRVKMRYALPSMTALEKNSIAKYPFENKKELKVALFDNIKMKKYEFTIRKNYCWDGAVVGTAYEQATDEVELNIVEVSDKLVVEITMVNFKEAPYSFFEMFGIKNYKIVDANGKVTVENENLEMSAIANNKVLVNVPLDDVGNGEYTLIVSELVGSAKAEQPLGLTGTWECSFRR